MRAWWLAAVALTGCTLIDQRTFNPHAGEKPVVVAPIPPVVAEAPELGAPALLRIPLPAPSDTQAIVARAVAAARARKADVAFTVAEIAPGPVAAVGEAAEAIARMIVADGVPAARVELAARPVPNVRREVRVYVR